MSTMEKLLKTISCSATAKARADVYNDLLTQNQKDVQFRLAPELPKSITGGWIAERSKALSDYARAKKDAHRANMELQAEGIAREAGASSPALVAELVGQKMTTTEGPNGELITVMEVFNPRTGKEYTIPEYISHLKGDGSFTCLFDGKAQPTATGGNAPNPWKKETRNLTIQGQITRQNPALADRLRAEANNR